MFLHNQHPEYRKPLDPVDAGTLGIKAAEEVERHLSCRDNHAPTPLHRLPALAAELGVGAIHVKDEGLRLGLGSFKALGGSYAVVRLVLEEASRQFGRPVDVADLHTPEVLAIASGMTVACATDGNHGRSVAQGAQLVGARAVIFVHSGVSDGRVAAIARFGAQTIRVDGTYDDSVAEAARVAAEKNWIVVSDTSWPGYERIPGLVMQGYTAMVRETLRQLPEPPTHVFVQAGVGGVAAAVAGHLSLVLGDRRPTFVVVDPSLVAWRVLSRVADAFMTVDEADAVAVMNRLARPHGNDLAIVAGESGGAGLAGLIRAATSPDIRAALQLTDASRVFVINTEGATDPERYAELVGMTPDAVATSNVGAIA
jgi:diaminopropionate ammonia-lyase